MRDSDWANTGTALSALDPRFRREFEDLLVPGGQMSMMGVLPEESNEKAKRIAVTLT
jgi:hypothetical protein